MEELELIILNQKDEKEINKEIKDFINNNENTSENIPSTFFLVNSKKNGKIIGSVKINHYLDKNLFNREGHIKINILQAEKEKNNYIELIKLALIKCKEYEIGRVLIYCNKNDILLKNAIENNGGILFKEMVATNENVNEKYYISLKKRYANRHKQNKPNSDLIYAVESFKEEKNNIDVSYYNFNNADIKIVTPKGKVIIDNNYKLLGFYNYNSKVKLSAFYDNNNEIIEWYFDIAKEIGKENGVPYEDDLYLDVVVRPDGRIKLLDENELKCALDKYEITKEEYKMAYEEANKLIAQLTGNVEKLKTFTDNYLKHFEKICK